MCASRTISVSSVTKSLVTISATRSLMACLSIDCGCSVVLESGLGSRSSGVLEEAAAA